MLRPNTMDDDPDRRATTSWRWGDEVSMNSLHDLRLQFLELRLGDRVWPSSTTGERPTARTDGNEWIRGINLTASRTGWYPAHLVSRPGPCRDQVAQPYAPTQNLDHCLEPPLDHNNLSKDLQSTKSRSPPPKCRPKKVPGKALRRSLHRRERVAYPFPPHDSSDGYSSHPDPDSDRDSRHSGKCGQCGASRKGPSPKRPLSPGRGPQAHYDWHPYSKIPVTDGESSTSEETLSEDSSKENDPEIV